MLKLHHMIQETMTASRSPIGPRYISCAECRGAGFRSKAVPNPVMAGPACRDAPIDKWRSAVQEAESKSRTGTKGTGETCPALHYNA